MHKIEIGKVGNFFAWNENFCAEIPDFFSFFAEQKLSLRTLPSSPALRIDSEGSLDAGCALLEAKRT